MTVHDSIPKASRDTLHEFAGPGFSGKSSAVAKRARTLAADGTPVIVVAPTFRQARNTAKMVGESGVVSMAADHMQDFPPGARIVVDEAQEIVAMAFRADPCGVLSAILGEDVDFVAWDTSR